MKARIKKSEIVLSIGMIVKNEEKYLQNCLKAIKPLLDAVPSELVIVDTGSSDRTLEIARDFTDKIFHFDWVNDFSAARNFSLSKCSGEWFMFLDADDHFTDVSELINFFNNYELNKKYKSAYYQTHNFSTTALTDYANFYVQRITRITSKLKFVNKIHEHFNDFLSPIYYFKAYANHYGYIATDNKKRERNLPLLLEELAEKPNNLRIIWHILDAYANNSPEKVSYIEQAAELIQNSKEEYAIGLCFKIAAFYKVNNDFENQIKFLNQTISKLNKDDAVLTEIFALKGIEYYSREMYSEAETELKNYINYYNKFLNDKLDLTNQPFILSQHTNEKSFKKLKEKLAFSLARQNRVNDAVSIYKDVVFSTLDYSEYTDIIDLFFKFFEFNNEFDTFSKINDNINKSCDNERIVYLNLKLEEKYYNNELTENFKPQIGSFAEFLHIAENYDETAPENSVPKITEFFNKYSPLPYGLSDALFFALKANFDLTDELKNTNSETIDKHLSIIAKYHGDFSVTAYNYTIGASKDFFVKSINNLAFVIKIFDISASDFNRFNALSENEKIDFSKLFASYSTLYIEKVYNPDLLNDSDIDILPKPHRIGFYYSKNPNDLSEIIESVYNLQKPDNQNIKIDIEVKEKAYKFASEHHTDDAISVYENTDFADIDFNQFKTIIDMIFDFTYYSLEYDVFTKVCDKINTTCGEKKINYLNQKLEDKLYSGSLSKRFKPNKGDFAELLKLAEKTNTTAISEFINKYNPIPEGISEAVSLAVKNNVDLTEAIEKMDYELMNTHILRITRYSKDIHRYALKYMPDIFFMQSIKNLGFATILFGTLSNNAKNFDYNTASEIYNKFVLFSSIFAENIYNPSIMNESDINMLPEICRFGCYMHLAQKELKSDNRNGYIKLLRKAYISCVDKTNAINYLLTL